MIPALLTRIAGGLGSVPTAAPTASASAMLTTCTGYGNRSAASGSRTSKTWTVAPAAATPSAIARLSEIGVPPYLISATLIGVVAQRLVRTLCPHCKQETDFERLEWDALIRPWTTSPPEKIARAEGCLECRQTGFIGRVGIYEMMPLVDELKQEISENFDLVNFRKAAIKQGMKPLNLAGAQKVARGVTTIEEVLKVAPPRYDL